MLRTTPKYKNVEDDFVPPITLHPAQTKSLDAGEYEAADHVPQLLYDCEPASGRADITLNIEELPTENGSVQLVLHVGNFGISPVTVRIGQQTRQA